jgi:hypothetical protein
MKKNSKNSKEIARRKAFQARSGNTKLTVGIDDGFAAWTADGKRPGSGRRRLSTEGSGARREFGQHRIGDRTYKRT